MSYRLPCVTTLYAIADDAWAIRQKKTCVNHFVWLFVGNERMLLSRYPSNPVMWVVVYGATKLSL